PAPCGDAVTRPEHSGAVRDWLSGRHPLAIHGDWRLQRLVRGLAGWALVDDGRAPQRGSAGARADGDWAGRSRRCDYDIVRERQSGELLRGEPRGARGWDDRSAGPTGVQYGRGLEGDSGLWEWRHGGPGLSPDVTGAGICYLAYGLRKRKIGRPRPYVATCERE